jgi:hypothetical protein
MDSRFLEFLRCSCPHCSCPHHLQYLTGCTHLLAYTGMLPSRNIGPPAHHKHHFRNRMTRQIQQFHSHTVQYYCPSVPPPNRTRRPGQIPVGSKHFQSCRVRIVS